ncbi:hypothetical protein OS493_001665 [Desmophyllum pertusum]|uniref:Mitochondrial genome maintenance protein MGM101 n=1 Tax=Desmophyllum pertusum TaxID=174260 RepID=A0A9W9ZGY7_9CNID|nr:hypothetical protein OS493_001665 [Desmophyllum pertusum]
MYETLSMYLTHARVARVSTRFLSTVQDGTSISTEEGETTTASQPANNSVDRLPDVFTGAATTPFSKEIIQVLMSPVKETDIEIKPDGMIYVPEIKYRRILNHAFGPGGWALVPRGESLQFQNDKDNSQLIVREYALFCLGRFVAQTVGEHTFYSNSNMVYGKAMESAKSNALMRCCKDLGVASELWDPQFIIQWKDTYAMNTWCENVRTRDKKKLWRRKDRKSTDAFQYPWKEITQEKR